MSASEIAILVIYILGMGGAIVLIYGGRRDAR